MSLRELATGGAGCAVDSNAASSSGLNGGAGAAQAVAGNPLSQLADAVLGGAGKLAEERRGGYALAPRAGGAEAGVRGGGGGVLLGPRARGQASSSAAAALPLPWELRRQYEEQRTNAGFDEAWSSAVALGQEHEAAWRDATATASAASAEFASRSQFLSQREREYAHLHPAFQAFFASAFRDNMRGGSSSAARPQEHARNEAAAAFSAALSAAPMQPPEGEEAARVRNRLSVMGRHVYAHLGPEAADGITRAMLEAMRIDAMPLMAPGADAAAAAAMAERNKRFAAEQAADSALAGVNRPDVSSSFAAGRGWADDFEAAGRRAALGGDARASTGDAWADELHVQQQQGGQLYRDGPGVQGDEWASDFSNGIEHAQRGAWADEFAQGMDASAVAGTSAATEAEDVSADGLRRNTAAVAEVMSSSGDPKMRQSQFLQFMSKMSRGEIRIEGNGVVGDIGNASTSNATRLGDAWADEFHTTTTEQMRVAGDGLDGPSTAWADEFTDGAGISPEEWAAEFDRLDLLRPPQSDRASASASASSRLGRYAFQPNNRYIGRTDALEIANSLFRAGNLSEAVLAMEAAVQADTENAEHWRMLGTFHAENDDDARAVVALLVAHEVDPQNLEVLLSLGVSHTNELNRTEAIEFLVQWLKNHPEHASLLPSNVPVGDIANFDAVIDIFKRAAAGSTDADIHVVLGVLYHLTRDFEASLASFEMALRQRPNDYSLWNKIGVTLANGSRSAEALSKYRRALELKPNYVRAWTNLGIGYANVSDFATAAALYVHALGMNTDASGVWQYLRMAVACAERPELLDAVEAKDLATLQRAFPLQLGSTEEEERRIAAFVDGGRLRSQR